MADRAREAELGIVPPAERLTVEECLRRGQWRVNRPVQAIIAGGYVMVLLLLSYALSRSPYGVLAAVALVIWPLTIPWLYWSVAVPKWRIWTLRHVDDWPGLEARAVAAMLTWPRGSTFGKTEIKSRQDRALERELIAYRDAHG